MRDEERELNMSKPQIYAKATIEEDKIKVKENIGCDGIEIQLLCEFLKGDELGDYYYAKDIMDLDMLARHNITVVHAPLFSYAGIADVNIETLSDSYNFKLLDQVCYMADYIGKARNQTILVIIHSEGNKENFMLMNDGWKRILNAIGCMLFKYPNIEFGLENVPPLRKNKKEEALHLCNNWGFDNVEMVKNLCEQFNTRRIGTVFDVCHAEISRKIINLISQEYGEYINPTDYTLEKYFEKNKPYIKLIHLSDTIGNGYGKGKHGMPFTKKSANDLYKYLDMIENNHISCPITLEVAETDYMVCNGYKETKQLVDEYYNF